ncbi:MAG: hypothetical protein ACR2QC_09315 [Gammaproteobacteria bacterium]
MREAQTARIPAFRRNGTFAPKLPKLLPQSHSCEGRNLRRRRKTAGKCTFVRLRRQFAPFGAEIPAFAGMGRGMGMKLKGICGKFCAFGAEIPAFAGMAALLRYGGTF